MKRTPGPWPFTEHASEHDPAPDSDLDAVSILLDKERAENERLRALLADIEDTLSHGRKTAKGEWLALSAHVALVATIRAALAAKKG